MAVVSYSLDEQETIINLLPKALSSKAHIHSTSPVFITKLRKLHKAHPDDVALLKDYGNELDAEVDASWIRISPKRKVSPEQAAQSAARLAAYRQQQKEAEDDTE